jgi:hypothetical protein
MDNHFTAGEEPIMRGSFQVEHIWIVFGRFPASPTGKKDATLACFHQGISNDLINSIRFTVHHTTERYTHRRLTCSKKIRELLGRLVILRMIEKEISGDMDVKARSSQRVWEGSRGYKPGEAESEGDRKH